MVTITKEKLDEVIKTIDGKETYDYDGSPLTFRKSLVAVCGTYQPLAVNPSVVTAGSEAVQAYALGKKIFDSEDLTLSEVEIDLLAKMIGHNRIFVSFITAQLLELIKSND